jgi:hypothetical protein
MAAPTLADFTLADNDEQISLTVPALPNGATGFWWGLGTLSEPLTDEFHLGAGSVDTGQFLDGPTYYARIAWGTAQAVLSDPSPAQQIS